MQVARNELEGSKAVSVLLMLIGLTAMGVSMFMNWRFGYSLSDDFYDRTAMGILHILVDPAAACLVVAGALMLRWGWKIEGKIFLGFAIILIAWSMLSVYGFMSSRIAMVVSHDKLVDFDKGRLAWAQGSSINSEVAKGDRRLLRAESKELSEKIRRQLSFIPDQQAASIAATFGVAVEKVQRFLVMVSSGIAQTIKFVCLLAGGMIWPRAKVSRGDLSSKGGNDPPPRKEPERSTGNIKSFPGKDQPKPAYRVTEAANINTAIPVLPGLPIKVSSRQSPVDELIQQILARGQKAIFSQTQIGRMAGHTDGYISKLLARAEKEGKVSRSRAGNRKMVRIRMGDGGGRQAIAVG